MKTKSIILRMGRHIGLPLLCLALLAGCSAERRPAGRPYRYVYQQSQFASRLEYLRFCQHYELLTYRCPD